MLTHWSYVFLALTHRCYVGLSHTSNHLYTKFQFPLFMYWYTLPPSLSHPCTKALIPLHSPPFWLYTTYIQRSKDVVFCPQVKAWEEMAYRRLTINANGFFDVDGDVGIKRLAGGLTQVMLTLQQFDTYKAHGWHAEAATDHPQPRLHAHLRKQKIHYSEFIWF